MIEGRPSATAERVAMHRAAHQVLDRPVLFEDPLAIRIVGRASAELLRVETDRFDDDRRARSLRALFVVRSRFAEDELAAAVRLGVRQYVILGAGLDTFPYRTAPSKSVLRVYEVDHPATQAWKRQRLDEGAIAVPDLVTYVPVDFETESLADELERAGFDAREPAFFSWLGVTPYLRLGSVMATLRYVAAATRTGGGVVFDYAIAPRLLPPRRRAAFDALARRVSAAGEPWQTFFEPSSLVQDLRAMGFGRVADFGPEELNARYFAGRADSLRLGGSARLMSASP